MGAILSIVVRWDCDHLKMHLKRCIPSYRFKRLDNANTIDSGCNFRYAHYYSDTVRTVYKAYGIRFVVIVDGKGGKFAITPFVLSLGSYLGLVGLAAITCDLVLKYIFRKCKSLEVYSEKKFTRITSISTETADKSLHSSNLSGGAFGIGAVSVNAVKNTKLLIRKYKTPGIVKYDHKSEEHMCGLAIVLWILHAIVIIVLILYYIWYDKGYQKYSGVTGSVAIKLKGVAITNFTDSEFQGDNNPDLYRRIWDTSFSDNRENGAFFVMTNIIITPNQTANSRCAEDYTIQEAICDPNSPTEICIPGKFANGGNGVMTGKCIQSMDPNINTCEITAWCPLESKKLPLGPDKALLAASKDFTVFIKNDIDFQDFDLRWSNVNNFNLTWCTYDEKHNPFCPIFKLDTIVDKAGQNYDEMAVEGGIISISIIWKCDHLSSKNIEKCKPKYKFRRLDSSNITTQRWNYRSASYYSDSSRTLYKIYGIRFIVIIEGKGGKFDFQTLIQRFAIYFTYAGLPAGICTTILCLIGCCYCRCCCRCCKKMKRYNDKRYTYITEEAEISTAEMGMAETRVINNYMMENEDG